MTTLDGILPPLGGVPVNFDPGLGLFSPPGMQDFTQWGMMPGAMGIDDMVTLMALLSLGLAGFGGQMPGSGNMLSGYPGLSANGVSLAEILQDVALIERMNSGDNVDLDGYGLPGGVNQQTGEGIQGISASTQTAPAGNNPSNGQNGQATDNTQRRQAIVDFAKSQIGAKDATAINRYTRGTGTQNGGWCSEFVSYVLEQAGGSPFGFMQSWDQIYNWAQENDRLSNKPKAGDIVIFRGHTGIVESVNNDGTITTIEGGVTGGVQRFTRQAGGNWVLGFVNTDPL